MNRIAVPHQPPRHPHAWWLGLAATQAAAAASWWQFGAAVGLPAFAASHAPLWWGTFAPGSRLFSPVLRRLPTRERVVWLTIDDGPSRDTPALLDLLDRHRAGATFFVVGERAQAQPRLVREIVERGHGIGHHSHSHPAGRFWRLTPAQLRREIDEAQQVLTALTGQAPRWFRAVVGHANPFLAAHLKRHGLARVAWSARGFDAVVGDPRRAVGRIERQLAPGAIVLAHEGSPHGRNLEILERLLQRLDALGYRTVLPE